MGGEGASVGADGETTALPAIDKVLVDCYDAGFSHKGRVA